MLLPLISNDCYPVDDPQFQTATSSLVYLVYLVYLAYPLWPASSFAAPSRRNTPLS